MCRKGGVRAHLLASISTMKNVLSILTTVFIGFALAMSPACSKDKKPAKPDPNKTESTETPSTDDKPEASDDQPAAGGGGGW
jgi:hypothetical protein